MSAYISRNNLSLLSQSQAAQRQTGILLECLSLLPQGKDCMRDQDRKVTGGGGGLEMGLTKVKHVSLRKQNAVVVSGAWRLGPASDQNRESFPGGEALATKRAELSPAGCPVWGIRNPGMPTGQSPSGSLRKQPSQAGLRLKGETQPGLDQDNLPPSRPVSRSLRQGPLQEGRAPSSVWVNPKAPQLDYRRATASSPPSPWCSLSPLLCRPPSAWRDEAKYSQGPGEHQPTHSFLPPRALRSCFPSVSGFPKVTLVTPAEDGGTAQGQEAGDLLYVTLDKSLLSES